MVKQGKLPAFQFYPADWRKDPGVQALTYEDRGIWFEMLCFMHESESRGRLFINGKTPSDRDLARILGLPIGKFRAVKTRLLDLRVADLGMAGELINRRMIRDDKLIRIRRESGRLGGNPSLIRETLEKNKRNEEHSNMAPIQEKLILDNQIPTTQVNQKPTPSSSSSSSSSSNSSLGDNNSNGSNHRLVPASKKQKPDPWAKSTYEPFCISYEKARGIPYRKRNHDFIQLRDLIVGLKLNLGDVPAGWQRAIDNFFASVLSSWTLADLCVRYDVFLNSPVDRFGKPQGAQNGRKAESQSGFTSRGEPRYVPPDLPKV